MRCRQRNNNQKRNQPNLETRDSTYCELIAARCCQTCRHYWNHFGSPRGECHAVEIRGELKTLSVSPWGGCDLWEGKET